MIEEHFRLKESPFAAGHQPRFVYPSREHQEAIAHLRYGVENREPFVLITGEVGTGKTTAVFNALDELGQRASVALITNSALTRVELLEEICLRFGVQLADASSKPQILSQLERHLLAVYGRSGRAVLIVDEAQNLGPDLLEEIRLLSNMENRGEPLLQIFLVGQPELESRLLQAALRQLRQRISVRYRLGPLDEVETEHYVHHRIAVAGGNAWQIFPSESCREIHRITHGVPREINTVASQAMLNAYVEDVDCVEPRHVRLVASDMAFQSVVGPGGRGSAAVPGGAQETPGGTRPEVPTAPSGPPEQRENGFDQPLEPPLASPIRAPWASAHPAPEPPAPPSESPPEWAPAAEAAAAAESPAQSEPAIPAPESPAAPLDFPPPLFEPAEPTPEPPSPRIQSEASAEAETSSPQLESAGSAEAEPPRPSKEIQPHAPDVGESLWLGDEPREEPQPEESSLAWIDELAASLQRQEPKPPAPAAPLNEPEPVVAAATLHLPPRLREKLEKMEQARTPKKRTRGRVPVVVWVALAVVVVALGVFFAWSFFRAQPSAEQSQRGSELPAGAPRSEAQAALHSTQQPQSEESPSPGAGPQASSPAPVVAPARVATSTDSPASTIYGVQVGSFRTLRRANQVQQEISSRAGQPGRVVHSADQGWYRVVLGEFPTTAQAAQAAQQLVKQGTVTDAVVVALASPPAP